MKKTNLIIASALLIGAFTSSANAEEDTLYYYEQPQSIPETDSEYVVPQSYNGQYYPAEREPATGYYGTQRDSRNTHSNDTRDTSASYENYYY